MLESHQISPSDALLDSAWVRAELGWIHQTETDAAEKLRILDGSPLPIAASMAHSRAETIHTVTPEDTARVAEIRALAKVLLVAGRAHSETYRNEEVPGDWAELLAFVREAVQRRAQLPDNEPWCRAATYVADRCESTLSSSDNEGGSGAYGVLRQLATVGAPSTTPAAWTLHIESPV
ncbi:hypothetical protein [Streptomyces sp. NPDC058757]|uniref:hypothetical protein n=1 Tax=Streptomyces sp. NPDC058757 TaxID=3346626 RepID=UPI00367A0080